MFNLPPGMTATILLIVVSTIAIVVSTNLMNNSSHNSLTWFFTKSPSEVRSKVTVFVAFPFWMWAVYRVITKGDPDIGSITFLLVIISALLNIRYEDKSKTAVFMLFSNVLLSLNYGLPLLALFKVKIPISLCTYLGIGSAYWAFMAIWNWKGFKADIERAMAQVVVNHEYGSIVTF